MSLNQTNTSLARTRSLRIPAKAALTASHASHASHASNASHASHAAPAPSQIPSSTSNVSLFLTNLRLLDLDLEPDWPGINLATFSAKDAAGGQKKRVQCVEWALYQLFSLWDYTETQNKLRPFYPPLDQVQSLNLRAALLRGLEQAKKNGVLGRDAVVRKTMLDECKGERLEEVLAVFSSAVLKKLVAERALNSGAEYRPTISENLALENWGYSGDRTELNGLLLAYKVSLASLLAKKNAARVKYRDFEELLALKEQGIASRREQAKAEAKQRPAQVSQRAKSEVHRIIKSNWAGNEQWLDGLVYNDTQSRKGGLLGTRFEDVWAGVQNGRVSDLEDQNSGLLEQLDNRVRLQRARFEKWDDFRKKMFGNMPSRPVEEARKEKKPKGIQLDFTAHQKLKQAQIDTEKPPPLDAPPPEYSRLVESMKAELDRIGKPKIPKFSNLVGASRRVSATSSTQYLAKPPTTIEPISDISECEEEPEEIPEIEKPTKLPVNRRDRLAIPRLGSQQQIPKAPSIDDPRRGNKKANSISSAEFKTTKQPQSRQPTIPSISPELGEMPTRSQPGPLVTSPDEVISPDISPVRSRPSAAAKPMPPPPRPISPTQALADEILASMSNASPSPTKKHRHTLSLTDRTRMTMTRTKSYEQDDESLPPSPVKSTITNTSTDTLTHDPLGQGEEYEDLVARTRRSMAGFEAARQKAQLERRRSQRQSKMPQRKGSYFPRLEEEEVGETSVAEELMEASQDDYEAVFKSRPRIQTSPLPSPSKKWDDE
ncbi:HAUS augmin-like complex subunit 6 N-terminus-domain-containing protein [Whalleya microplaca]|nr:HAUS augmin-like complex subunit 6 N-terminus-domain-containing protein [Whalleya microplaca]